MREIARIVCTSTSTGPAYVAESVVRQCGRCNDDLWVAPSSLRIRKPVEFLCLRCAAESADEADEVEVMAITPAQRDELRRWMDGRR